MTAKVITMSLQKGGVSKTSTTAIFSYLLSQRGNRVLVIDMDSQANMTTLLTGLDDLEVLAERTSLEAMREHDVRPYILTISDTLHLVPADDFVATSGRLVYGQQHSVNPSLLMKKAIEPVIEEYDYIFFDTPPALSELTVNSLAASTHVVVITETSKFAFNAIRNFTGTCKEVQKAVNPELKVVGILRGVADARRKDTPFMLQIVEEKYGKEYHIFDSIISRSASVARLPLQGFQHNQELQKIETDYAPILEEVLNRVNEA